eukprot:9486455-Pyramimonas_sp.AAC.1
MPGAGLLSPRHSHSDATGRCGLLWPVGLSLPAAAGAALPPLPEPQAPRPLRSAIFCRRKLGSGWGPVPGTSDPVAATCARSLAAVGPEGPLQPSRES